jgi:uridine kinase
MKPFVSNSTPCLVAIVGPSGAGKSWLARQLQARLGKETSILRLDDFYRDKSHLPMKRRDQLNFDHPRSIDWTGFQRVLLQCAAGQPIQIPRYDFKTHCRLKRTAQWRPKRLVLVEGLWLLQRPSIRRLFALRIYVRCPGAVQLRRRLRRDRLERGRSPASVKEVFVKRVAPMARRHVHPQERWADLVVRSPVPVREVERLAEQLRRLLVERGVSSLKPSAGDKV